MNLILNYGFWELWQLYHKVTFDGDNKLILINDGETEIDIQRDIYSSWKEWALIDDYSKFTAALSTSGGEPTTGGQSLGSAFFLINGWKIRPWNGNYEIAFTGNLFTEDESNPIIPSTEPSNILITRVVSNIVTQINTDNNGGGLTEEQAEQLAKTFKNTKFHTALLLSK